MLYYSPCPIKGGTACQEPRQFNGALSAPFLPSQGGATAGPPIWPGAPAPHLRVLRFWFGGEYAENHRGKWFAAEGSPSQSETDRHVREEFGPLLREAEAGRLEVWVGSLSPFRKSIHK